MSWLSRIAARLSGRNDEPDPDRPVGLIYDTMPGMVYAVGDVHGCLAELQAVDAAILADCARHGLPAVIVTLGDHIDRGPDSAGVIRHLMQPLPGQVNRICLMGNHEAMFLDFLANPDPAHPVIGFGGAMTLRSYGIEAIPDDRAQLAWRLGASIPPDHVAFLRDMPLFVKLPGIVCVHGGLDPDRPLSRQDTKTMLWHRPQATRSGAPVHGQIVIHGHTQVAEVDASRYRYNLDTGAYRTGKLSAVRIDPDGNITLLI